MKRMLCLIILSISILLNVILVYLLVLSERMNHSIEIALDKRNLIKMNETHRPDYWILQGWTNSIAKAHAKYDIAFFGNSLTYNSDFQRYYPDYKIINLGVSGNTLKDMKRRISTLVAACPNKVFIMAGANDLVVSSVVDFIDDYSQLLNEIQKELPDANIYIQSILPMNSDAGNKQVPTSTIIEANEKLKTLAQIYDIKFVDIYSKYSDRDTLPSVYSSDGLHLKENAYDIWAQAIKDYIEN